MKYRMIIYVNSNNYYEGEINKEVIYKIEEALQDKRKDYIEFGPDNNDRTVYISKANINIIKIDKIGDK